RRSPRHAVGLREPGRIIRLGGPSASSARPIWAAGKGVGSARRKRRHSDLARGVRDGRGDPRAEKKIVFYSRHRSEARRTGVATFGSYHLFWRRHSTAASVACRTRRTISRSCRTVLTRRRRL